MPVCLGGAIPERGALEGRPYPGLLGLEVHLELAAHVPSVPEGLWPPQGICVFLESVVRGN